LNSGIGAQGTSIIGYSCQNNRNNQVKKIETKKLTFITINYKKKITTKPEKIWYYTKNDEIRQDDKCLHYTRRIDSQFLGEIVVYNCLENESSNQMWIFTENGLIKHVTGVCIELDKETTKTFMNICDINNTNQLWYWNEKR
jgi:hypothetical protein